MRMMMKGEGVTKNMRDRERGKREENMNGGTKGVERKRKEGDDQEKGEKELIKS